MSTSPPEYLSASPRSLGARLLHDALAKDPSGASLPIGLRVLRVAYDERGESFIVQNRQDPRLLRYFEEGCGWTRAQWEAQFKYGPHWCAAFASYCYRKAYEHAGLAPPLGFKGEASCEGWMRVFKGSFLPAKSVVSGGVLRGDVSATLGPGDIVCTDGHVALLAGFSSGKDGAVVNTIEGNTNIWLNGTPESAAWGIHPRDFKAVKMSKLLGFLRIASAPQLPVA